MKPSTGGQTQLAAPRTPEATPGVYPEAMASTRRTATTRRYLMCPPTHFDVVYSINPWMDPSKPVDPRLAVRQWQRIHDLYVDLGHTVELIPPLPGMPDMVFAANGATVIDGRVLVARFLYEERDAESGAYLDWFASRGFEVRQAAWTNEGEGDYLVAGDWLLAGSGFRTDRRSHAESEQFFGRPVIGLTLVNDNFYHLDTALSVLDKQTVMYYPAAFTAGSRAILQELFPDAIIATEDDAQSFGLNAASDGHHVILPAGATRLAAELRSRGFEAIGAEVSELLRAGGGVKCCTLEVRDRVPARPAPGPADEDDAIELRGQMPADPAPADPAPAGLAPEAGQERLPVVVTSVACDSHNWNLVYLQLALEEMGYRTVNLGPCVPDDLLISECLRIRPGLIVVSSVNGHGFFDGMRLISRIRDCQELAATPVVIGGKLGIAGHSGGRSRDELLAAGFDAVFEEGTGMAAFRAFTQRLAMGVSR